MRQWLRVLVLALGAVLSCHAAWAQTDFARAKEALDKGNYALACLRFDKLAKKAKPDQQAEFLFMGALAYIRDGQPKEAISRLERALALPDGAGIQPEVAELLGEQYLQQGEWRLGAKQLATREETAQRALFALLEKCPDDTLKALGLLYPKAAGIQRQITKRGPPKASEVAAKPSTLMRIGLVLPLQIQPDAKTNQGMAEFCIGALLAQEDLRKEGIELDLPIFDTHHQPDTVENLVKAGKLEKLDLLIGPVYAKEVPPLAAFCNKESIPMLNPLGRVGLADQGKFAFSAQPSVADLAQATYNLRPIEAGGKVGIIYGTRQADSLLAFAFADLVKAKGGSVSLIKKVGQNSAANLPKFLTEAALDSTSLLFVPNNEPLVRAQLPSALEITHCQALPVVDGSWLEETEISLDRFERLGIRLLNPEIIDPTNAQAAAIRSRIQATYGLPATEIGLKAYDMVYALAKTWSAAKPDRRGTFLRDYSPIRGLFGPGYDFALGQSNARVLICHLEGGNLVFE